MKNIQNSLRITRLPSFLLVLTATLPLLLQSNSVYAQWLTLANPHWNITLTDAGYSDFLLDNTPGFEGREYLSGEWGAAVGYQRNGGQVVAPQWLEPMFQYPNWETLTTFATVTPITQTGLNADNLPIAQSVLGNGDLEITLRHEMLDTIVGTPMGTTPASSSNAPASLNSSRYVLKQTATIRNISGAAISDVQFFQFLHGLSSERGVFDNHSHPGSLSNYQHDVTLAGVDAGAVGAGSSTAGLEDFIGFHAVNPPSAFEIGYYGIEGNGVDDHSMGKPSEGVHLSVENNWQTPPYSTRQGTDSFHPPTRWVGGAQRWNLGNLAAGQSVTIDVLLSVRSGTRVTTGTGSTGGCNGGSSVPGGVDYEFEDVSVDGSCFGEYAQADASEIAMRVDEGEFTPFDFLTPGGLAQIWKLQFNGVFSGNVNLNFGYDASLLPPGFNEANLALYEFTDGSWQKLAAVPNPVTHTIAATTTNLSVFALGVEALVTFTVDAGAMPANSGTITGAGPYAEGATVTLIASPATGYVFSNWTESGSVISTSPSFTFLADADRTLEANFIAVGSAISITTASLPANGGTTSGDGAYALGSSATVSATANDGYKFSKWLVNGVSVSTARNYTFTVASNRVLVAKFKPVYSLTLTADPVQGGDVEGDPVYEVNELAKLKAKPNTGYCFVNWTQNGVPVSTDPNYQFNMTGNRELVGHFALGHRIDASVYLGVGGTATGGGVYGDGDTATIEATAYPGYVFVNWTEAGDVVSTSASYSFTSVADRSLVANFIAQPPLGKSLSAPGQLTLSWPAGASGWVLQECAILGAGNWTNSVRAVNTVGNQKSVTVPPGSSNAFFRLAHP